MRKKILYQEIASIIKERILKGIYPLNDLIPTERDLECEFEVSKITIRNAIELLVTEGYLEKKSGYGTKVISNNFFNKLSKARSYSSIMQEQGDLRKEILVMDEVSNEVIPPIYRNGSSKIIHIRRIYFLGKQPFVLFDHYLPTLLEVSQLEGIEEKSLYNILKETGQTINRFQDDFRAIMFDKETAAMLKTTSTLGVKRVRKGFDLQGILIEYSLAFYDTERFPYEIDYEV